MTLLLLALAPGLVIALYVYIRDKYEREPFGLVAWTFALGAFAAVIAALLESLFPYQEKTATLLAAAANATLLVGPVEEVMKFLAVRLFAYRSSQFNEPFDGVVYCVMAGMGFATLENLMYVLSGGVGIGIERAFISVPGHAAYAIIMGYYLGRAKFEGPGKSRVLMIQGVVFAAVAHGIFDFGLFSHTVFGLLLTVATFLFAVACAWRAMRESTRISGRYWASERA